MPGILDAIMNPKQLNMGRNIEIGQERRERRGYRDAREQYREDVAGGMVNPQALKKLAQTDPGQAGNIQITTAGIDKGIGRTMAFDVFAAFSVGGDKATTILNNLAQKVPEGPMREEILAVAALPADSKERNSKLLQGISIGQAEGFLPKPTKATKTAGQLERGVRVDEEKLKIAKGTLAMQNLQVENKRAENEFALKQLKQEAMLGKVPSGFMRTEDGGVIPIPGSKQDIARKEKQKRLVRGVNSTISSSGIILDNLDLALGKINGWTAGLGGSVMRKFSGTQATDLLNLLEPVIANISFDTLSEIKAASATGSALGSISERELNLLGKTKGSLDVKQSPEQLMKQIATIQRIYKKTLSGAKKDFGHLILSPEGGGGYNVSEQDIIDTMAANPHLTREEVEQRAKGMK
jgi:hypothetical protein